MPEHEQPEAGLGDGDIHRGQRLKGDWEAMTDNDKVPFSDNDAETYMVRRLTPRECERLQGFPDDWTRISWKGKPLEECPDGPRYKAIGNSMCVNVMRWIGERIERCERERRATESV